MQKRTTILETDEAWESGKLGENPKSARAVAPEMKAQIDDDLGLQMISIRLEKELIDSFKMLGEFHGLGYQPLMRDALKRFAATQMKEIISGLVQSQKIAQAPKKASAPSKSAPVKPASAKMKKAA